MLRRRSVLNLLGAMACTAPAAIAQTPSPRTLRVVVPLGPGTLTDTVSRLIAPRLSAVLNQPVVVENKAGGNGVIGVQEVMRAAPDGTTVLMGSVSSLAINMALMKNPPYDSRRDLVPIAGAYVANHVWLVRPDFPARTFGEFIAYAKANPGRVKVGEASTLVKIQLAAIEKMAGIQLLTVPYKAIGTALTDVMGGTLDMTLLDTAASIPLVKGGQLRALGVSSPKRNPAAPDWPAVAEFVPGFDFVSWTAMVGPAGLPPEVVARLNAAMVQVLKQKEISENLEKGGALPFVSTPDELKAYLDTEVTKWTRVAREANIPQE